MRLAALSSVFCVRAPGIFRVRPDWHVRSQSAPSSCPIVPQSRLRSYVGSNRIQPGIPPQPSTASLSDPSAGNPKNAFPVCRGQAMDGGGIPDHRPLPGGRADPVSGHRCGRAGSLHSRRAVLWPEVCVRKAPDAVAALSLASAREPEYKKTLTAGGINVMKVIRIDDARFPGEKLKLTQSKCNDIAQILSVVEKMDCRDFSDVSLERMDPRWWRRSVFCPHRGGNKYYKQLITLFDLKKPDKEYVEIAF